VARSACERQKTSGRLLANGTRFRRIDDQNRSDHFNLTAADECYFLREYKSGKNYKFGETNNLISNLKKEPSQSRTRGYRYKTSAIEQCAREISAGGLRLAWLRIGTLLDTNSRTDKRSRHETGDDARIPGYNEITRRTPKADSGFCLGDELRDGMMPRWHDRRPTSA
jgi:hypothetical protein